MGKQRKKITVLTPEQRVEVARLYAEKGRTARSLATEFNVVVATVYHILREQHKDPHKSSLTEEQKKLAIRLYQEGQTLKEVAVQIPCDPSTVADALEKAGIPRRKYQSPSVPRINLTGQRFGRWEVEGPDCKKHSGWYWWCVCDCTIRRSVAGTLLRQGKSRSCGCYHSEVAAEQAKVMGHANMTHGMTDTPEWLAWKNMIRRCHDTRCDEYKSYGALGVTVCEEWRESSTAFLSYVLEHLGRRPDGHELDRIDPYDNYRPGNIRWVTAKEQQRNRREHCWITWNGRRQCATAWEEELGFPKTMLWRRLFVHGWELEEAMTTPPIPRGQRTVRRGSRIRKRKGKH